jgi:imidazolonepropionase-like amidohydrolase
MRFSLMAVFFLLLCAGGPIGRAQERLHLLLGATIYPIEGAPIQRGMILFQHGKILNLGPEGSFPIPSDALTVDMAGKVILPGLVDTHSHVGGGSGGDRSSPLHPDVRILDAIDVRNDTFKKVIAGGITTVNVMPGSGHLMSGQTAYLKMRPARTIDGMLFCSDPTNGICGGMKMANGTNSIGERPFPGTRAKSAALVRQLFLRAQDYRSKVEAAKGDSTKLPKRDLEMEPLVQILEGKRIVQFHTHRADDIMTAIRLSQEFGFRMVLHHVTEAWKVAREIAAAKVPCSIIVIDSPGGKLETVDLRFDNGAELEKAGAIVAFHTDDGITDSRLFMRSAALAVRAGMSREKALEGLTLAGAKMLDLDGRVGSLKPGKDADFAILSGDPFSVYTHVEQTWVEGTKVFDRSNPDDKKYAVGGYGVFRQTMTGDECEGGGQ